MFEDIKCLLNKHPEYIPIQRLAEDIELIQCTNCKKMYAINYRARVILPWTRDLYLFHKEIQRCRTGAAS